MLARGGHCGCERARKGGDKGWGEKGDGGVLGHSTALRTCWKCERGRRWHDLARAQYGAPAVASDAAEIGVGADVRVVPNAAQRRS